MTKLRADKCQTTTQESTTSRRAEKFFGAWDPILCAWKYA